MFKTIKKFTSCFLVLCMLLSMVPMGVFATETINYVSLGDSMANGYGLAGYQPAQGNVNGYRQEAPGAYPAKVAAAKGWDLTQLAVSAMRAEDLNFILNFDWGNQEQLDLVAESQSWSKADFVANKSRWDETFGCGDLYTWDEFVDNRFNDYEVINPAESGTAAYAQMYQNSVADADYLSLGIGNANFGVFMLGRITNAFGVLGGTSAGDAWIEFQDVLSKLDEPSQAAIMEVYNKLTSYLTEQNYIAVEQAELLTNTVAYAVASYVFNYAEAIDRIVELNPDVNIILVGLMNTMSGSKMSFWGNEIDLGDILDIVINTMNTYIAALPSAMKLAGNYEEATFYYAEEPHVEMVVNTLDDAWTASWTGDGYDVIRERLVEDICNGMVFEMVAPLFSGYGITLDTNLSVADVENYETNGSVAFYPDMNKIASCQVYLAFEDAIVDSTQIEVMDAEAVFSLADPAKLNEIFAEIGAQVEPADLQVTLTAALTSSPAMKSLLNLFARHIIGNGIGSHPSAVGHDALTVAILDTLENEYTTNDKVIDAAKDLVEFIEKYGEEAVERIYNYLESEGYIAELKTAIDKLVANLENPDSDLSQKIVSETDKLLAILEVETGEELPSGEEVITAIRNYEETLAELEEYIANNEKIQETIATVKTIVAQIKDIIANPEVYIQNVIDDVVAKYEENLAAATTADYVACGENHYVAFAGTNTSGVEDYEYSYKFGDYIDATDASTHYFTDATPIADAVDYINNLSDTAKADLQNATIVTYQTDAKNIVLPLVDRVDVTADDWAALLDVDAAKAEEIKATIIAALKGEYATDGTAALNEAGVKAAEIKDRILAKLPTDWATKVVEEGEKADETIDAILSTAYDIVNCSIDPALVDTIEPLVEELIFNTVAYLVNNIKSVEAIKAINPDALVAVVGLHNPVKGLKVNVDGQIFDLGKYVDYFIEATNVYNTIYAASSKNVIFVKANETGINGYDDTIMIDTSDLLSFGYALVDLDDMIDDGATVVTENGHNYIANQLKAAITKVDHIDTNSDNLCDKCETNLAPVTPTPTPNRPGPGGSGGGVASSFTIKFETNGGSKVDDVKVENGKSLAEPAAPTKNGFTFDGWYTDKELTKKYDFSQKVTKSFTLYAKWIEDEFKNPFVDVNEGDWFYDAVMFVLKNSITKGVSDTEYAPYGKVTRAQFITMLCRAYEIKEMTGDNFADCGDTWYTGYLAAAKQLGISNGVGDNMFAPEKEITREEMVTLIYNYLKSINKVTEEAAELSFADSNNVSEWAKTAVAYAAENGIVNGKGYNIFDPQGTATRAELAQIFYNMFK